MKSLLEASSASNIFGILNALFVGREDKNSKNNAPFVNKSIANESKNLIMTFPELCDNTLPPSTAAMISKANERNIVTMLELLFASWNINANNGIEALSKVHKNIQVGMSLDDVIDAIDNMVEESVKLSASDKAYINEQVRIIKEQVKLPQKTFPVNSFNERSLNEFTVYNVHGQIVVREAKNNNNNNPLDAYEQQIRRERQERKDEIDKERLIQLRNQNDSFDDEQERKKNEELRKQAEEKRKEAEELRREAEELRKQDEELRRQADELRKQQDELRKQEDNERKRAEELRKQKADDRQDKEELRREADEKRKRADEIRKQNDELRKQEQQIMKRAEEARKIADEKRKDAEETRKQADELRKQEDNERKRAEELRRQKSDLRDDYKASLDTIQRRLLDTDVRKANELQPTLMIVNYNELSNGELTGKTKPFVIGVKSRLIACDNIDIVDRLIAKNKTKINFLNLIRATTGEIGFLKDFLLCIDQNKIDARNSVKKGPSAMMWKVLEARGIKNNGNKRKRNAKHSNDATAITTLVISQETVNIMKQMYDFDLEKIANTKMVMEAYNLLGIVIADESLEIAKFFYDGNDMYEQQAYMSLEKEGKYNSDKKINLMGRVNGGY